MPARGTQNEKLPTAFPLKRRRYVLKLWNYTHEVKPNVVWFFRLFGFWKIGPSWEKFAFRRLHRQRNVTALVRGKRVEVFWAKNYNFYVARGWGSKSVEAQQAEVGDKSSALPGRKMTPAESARQRTKDGLLLSRKRVIAQLDVSHDVRHRQMLQKALEELDEKLSNLEP
jgi:hypothetical protein